MPAAGPVLCSRHDALTLALPTVAHELELPALPHGRRYPAGPGAIPRQWKDTSAAAETASHSRVKKEENGRCEQVSAGQRLVFNGAFIANLFACMDVLDTANIGIKDNSWSASKNRSGGYDQTDFRGKLSRDSHTKFS